MPTNTGLIGCIVVWKRNVPQSLGHLNTLSPVRGDTREIIEFGGRGPCWGQCGPCWGQCGTWGMARPTSSSLSEFCMRMWSLSSLLQTAATPLLLLWTLPQELKLHRINSSFYQSFWAMVLSKTLRGTDIDCVSFCGGQRDKMSSSLPTACCWPLDSFI